MTRIEALKELLAKVEARSLPEAVFHGCHGVRGHWAYSTPFSSQQRTQIYLAYNGSLDAAKALHDAVLPGWPWTIENLNSGFFRAWTNNHVFAPRGYVAQNANPARAWLIVILEALIVQAASQ